MYKCRRCGKVNKGAHAPDGQITLMHLLFGIVLPKKWGGAPIDNRDICNCDDGNYGVCDLIGFKKDGDK